MAKTNSSDRHSPDSVQLKAWVPRQLRARFNACARAQGVPAAEVLRDLLTAYCSQVESLGAGAAAGEGGNGEG
jgi:hypothetical protein